ncbi:MAG: thermonuclease family protein [Deltaproteobacteria bacterium]|nr:thermonuclease family protein [Deltaproteobacteria bacterium]
MIKEPKILTMCERRYILPMKNKFNLLLYLIILILITVSYADQLYSVKVVFDGDTIMLSNRKHVRYIGIDSPEMNYKKGNASPFGFEAKKTNEKLLSGKAIRIEYDIQKKDHYGRILAYVYTADGIFLNNEMIKKGYAWNLFKGPNTKYSKVFLTSQHYAMSNKLGIWNNWQEKDGVKYLGNIKSKKFHHMDCTFGKQIAYANRIIFQKKWDAFYAGFSPCRRCILKQNG